METEKVKISDIKPYKNNAKKHPESQIGKIAESIKHFGFNQPIVVDKDNNIIVGHGRWEAAKKLKLEEVPIMRKENLSESQVKAYRLADNKLNESEWDMDLAIPELKGLDKMNFDLELTGFLDNTFEDNPDFDISDVKEGEVSEKEQELNDKMKAEAELRKVICPECGYEFKIKKD